MKYVIALCLFCTAYATEAQLSLKKLKSAVSGQSLSSDEIASGLKEALANGTTKGTDLVSQLDGYYKNPEIKIPFPPEVKQVETRLRQVGLGSEVDKFVESLNRGAEDAAKEAKPIFISAIKQMTIQDAYSILKGSDDAATQYLNKTTSPSLKEKFLPVIRKSLEKVNATKYYSELVTAYNKIPLVQKVNPELDQYATDRAIQGLFIMIAKEEKNIRQNPVARTSDLLKKVFGAN